MMLKYLVFAIVVFIYRDHEVSGANILGFLTTPSRSHYIVHSSLLKGLAAKGHNVTVVCMFPSDLSENSLPNYHQIHLEMGTDDINNLQSNLATIMKNPGKSTNNVHFHFISFIQSVAQQANKALKHPATVNLLNSGQKFDLLVLGWFFNDFHLGLAAHFKCPSIVISSMPSFKPLRDFVANPSGFQVNPFIGKPTPGAITFWNRVLYFLGHAFEFVGTEILNQFSYSWYYEDNFPAAKNYPSFSEIKKNVSLVLVSHHFSQGGIRPYMPNMIEISGIQIKNKPDALPTQLERFLNDSSEHGAILFSFGTNVKSSDFTTETLTAVFASFSKLKQKILWKWDESEIPAEKPNNVLMVKWLPQDDILAHPNIRLFISHCGLGGVNEAKFHGVPILGIPLFGDQQQNAKVIVVEGWAIELPYESLTEATLSAAINEMLSNQSYANTVKKLSLLYRDRPQTAMETAIFWTEYVLRHNGAPHMRSPLVHMNFLQKNSIDVFAFLILCLYVIYKLIKWSTLKLIGCLYCKKKVKIN